MATIQNDQVIEFLLGKLTEEERSEIERRFLEDGTFFEEVLIAENELIDGYAAGKISDENRELFKSRLLLSPRQKQRVQFAKTLAAFSPGLPPPDDSSNSLSRKPAGRPFIPQFLSGKPFLSLAFATALSAIFFAGLWLIWNSQIQEQQTEELVTVQTPENKQSRESVAADTIDEIPAKEPDEASSSARPDNSERSKTNKGVSPKSEIQTSVLTIILTPGLTRGGGAAQRFDIPARTDVIRLRLQLEDDNFSTYRALLETVEGDQIWSSGQLKSSDNGSISILIPAKLMRKADYILSLKGLNRDGIYERVEDYSFTINPGR